MMENENELKQFYITFGQSHRHIINEVVFDKDCVGIINANTHEKAREIAFKLFSDVFFTTYDSEDFNKEHIKYFPRGFINVN